MASFLELSRMPAVNTDGTREAGAKLFFYVSGELDDAMVYQDADLSAAHPQPVVADAEGVFPDIYLDDAVRYRAKATNAAEDQTYFDTDPVNPMPDSVAELSAAVAQAQTAATAAQNAADTATSVLEAVQEGNAQSFVAKSGDTLSGSLNVLNTTGSAISQFVAGQSTVRTDLLRYSNDAAAAGYRVAKARGSYAYPAAVNSGDSLGTFSFLGYDGTSMRTVAVVTASVVAPSPSSTDMEGRLIWSLTANGSGVASEFARWEHDIGFSMYGANVVIDNERILRLRSYTVASLTAGVPSPAPSGKIVYCSDGASNKRLAVSDGTNWRYPDGSVVS